MSIDDQLLQLRYNEEKYDCFIYFKSFMWTNENDSLVAYKEHIDVYTTCLV